MNENQKPARWLVPVYHCHIVKLKRSLRSNEKFSSFHFDEPAGVNVALDQVHFRACELYIAASIIMLWGFHSVECTMASQ